MVEAADLIVACKEYPHTDFGSTAARLLALCDRKRAGEIEPVSALVDCRMVGLWRTTEGPVQHLVEQMRALEQRPAVLSVSFAHGFPWADVADSGARMLVTTDGDPALASELADALRKSLWDLRDCGRTAYLGVTEALDAAAGEPGTGPVVLADVSDNTGGGAAGDSTFLLEAILDRGLEKVAVCSLWDPMAVQLCIAAGEGARLPLRLGGKTGPASGRPLDVEAEIRSIVPSAGQTFQGAWVGIGDSVWLRVGGVDVIVCSLRQQTFDPSIMTQFGIDPSQLDLIVVKSTQHFHRGFAGIARRIIYVAAPGANYPDFSRIAYCRKRGPYWPAVDDPFADPAPSRGR
jgi:microcystin degradation protein MlrC